MSVWPFKIGRFMELPATLVQDNTLVNLLGERTPQIWLDKVEYLKQFHGMALLNSHPDYLIRKTVRDVYTQFLDVMQKEITCWNVLPRDAARLWRRRTENILTKEDHQEVAYSVARLNGDNQFVIDNTIAKKRLT